MENQCWECKHNVLEIMVLVPVNGTIREYVHRTGDFRSDVVAVVKEQNGQYTVWFRAEGSIKLVTFKMIHTCKLKMKKNKKELTCKWREAAKEQNYISNITYSKVPTAQLAPTTV